MLQLKKIIVLCHAVQFVFFFNEVENVSPFIQVEMNEYVKL